MLFSGHVELLRLWNRRARNVALMNRTRNGLRMLLVGNLLESDHMKIVTLKWILGGKLSG
jgi:hypothetical protein